jgi:hypothetical protein
METAEAGTHRWSATANGGLVVRLIPGVLLTKKSSAKSAAERRLFEILKTVDLGPHWTAYHSLNCSEHAYKHWAEIDFLILGPEGALVLEVKGGRVTLRDGIWIFKDRDDREHLSSEGPFNQARSAMYALRDLLSDRYRVAAVVRERLVFGFGVVFPDVDWEVDTSEMPADVVADKFAVTNARNFAKYLKHLKGYWQGKWPDRRPLEAAELREIRQRIRPDVDVFPAFSTRLGRTLEDMQRLTDEQYERLDVIDQNDRVVISGGAGTGKTFLLMQCARRERALGRRVLIVTESPTLAAHLRSIEKDPGISVGSDGGIRSAGDPYDVLFVDEGQDLMTMEHLDRLSSLLKGGLDDGRWRWFMDENNQTNVSGRFDKEALEYLLQGLPTGRPVRLPLRRNVRNTKEIIARVHEWTSADLGTTELTGHGRSPEVVVCRDQGEVASQIARTIESLQRDDVTLDQMGLVVRADAAASLIGLLPPSLRGKTMLLDPVSVRAQVRGKLVWGTPKQFKGLERPVVLLAGFERDDVAGDDPSEFYVASTRGNYSLTIFCDASLAEVLRTRAGGST